MRNYEEHETCSTDRIGLCGHQEEILKEVLAEQAIINRTFECMGISTFNNSADDLILSQGDCLTLAATLVTAQFNMVKVAKKMRDAGRMAEAVMSVEACFVLANMNRDLLAMAAHAGAKLVPIPF
jgi:hypothetical protein